MSKQNFPISGTNANNYAAGNDSRITGALQSGSVAGGDLTGTLPSPAVSKINGITLPGTAPSSGNVLTATSAATTSWTTPAAGVMLDSTSTDIVAGTTTGSGVAGSVGKAADAGHQHPLVAHDHTTTNKGGQIPVTGLNITGTASATTYLRGDGSWTVPSATDASKLAIANNLSDLASISTARSNLGLGSVATQNTTAFDGFFGIASSTTSAANLAPNVLTPVDATAGTVPMTLPSGQTTGTRIGVRKQDATTNAVTITGNIAGVANTTHALALNAETVVYETDSSASWWVVGGNKSLSSLDSRYPLNTATPGGDLAGTYAAPSVAKLNGVTISGTPGTGKVLTATSVNAASWQTSSAGSSTLVGDTDVAIASPLNGQFLIYNGSQWSNQTSINPVPSTFGYIGWTNDPIIAVNASAGVSGRVYLIRFHAAITGICDHLLYYVNVAGSGFTAGENIMGIYDTGQTTANTATLLGQTADQVSNLGTAGVVSAALTSPVSLQAGQDYFVSFILVATTMPQFCKLSALPGFFNYGLSGLSLRTARHVTSSQTFLPSTIAVANVITSSDNYAWTFVAAT